MGQPSGRSGWFGFGFGCVIEEIICVEVLRQSVCMWAKTPRSDSDSDSDSACVCDDVDTSLRGDRKKDEQRERERKKQEAMPRLRPCRFCFVTRFLSYRHPPLTHFVQPPHPQPPKSPPRRRRRPGVPRRRGPHGGVIAPAAEGVAAEDPPGRQDRTLGGAKLLDGLHRVFGAGGEEAAGGREEGGDELLVALWLLLRV